MHADVTELQNKILDSKVPIAVFVKDGIVRRCKVTTQLFQIAMHNRPETLIGVYNSDCDPRYIEDDLRYMGVIP